MTGWQAEQVEICSRSIELLQREMTNPASPYRWSALAGLCVALEECRAGLQSETPEALV